MESKYSVEACGVSRLIDAMGRLHTRLHDLHLQLLDIEAKTRLRLMPPDLELLLYLYADGRLTSTELAVKVRCSPAGFGLVKKRLLEAGLIVSERCTDDRRVTYFALAPAVFEAFQGLESLNQDSSESKSVFSSFSEALVISAKDAVKA